MVKEAKGSTLPSGARAFLYWLKSAKCYTIRNFVILLLLNTALLKFNKIFSKEKIYGNFLNLTKWHL